MRRWVDLTEEEEKALQRLAQTTESSEDVLIRAFTEAFLRGHLVEGLERSEEVVLHSEGRELRILVTNRLKTIRSSSNVLGGDARVRDTRIPIWLLVAHKKWGESDSEILTQYPSLNATDLTAAWDFYTVHSERVDAERRANEGE